jgi:hypothetical protein
MKTFSTSIIALVLCCVAMPSSQAEEAPRSSLKIGQMLRDAGAPAYSCDLRVQFNQCRQYAVSPGQAAARIAQIEESCTSLGGRFAQAECPNDAVIARCREVMFRRDAFYDNSYYAGEPAQWTPEALEHACKHLPGQFESVPGKLPQTTDSQAPEKVQ